jgi:hypothetical protein
MRLNERIFKTEIKTTLCEPAACCGGQIDILASKILNLEERIENFGSDANKRYKLLKENVKKIKTDIVESKEEREREFEQKVAELLQVERTFEDTIDAEKAVPAIS